MIALIMPGPTELMWILGAAVVLFGAKRLPVFARSLGQSVVELKRGFRDIENDEPEKLEDRT